MLDRTEIERWERLTDAMLRHAAADDPQAFAQVVQILDRAVAKLPEIAQRLRWSQATTDGETLTLYSWADLGAALGVTRSAAQQRFGSHRVKAAAGA